MKRTGSTGGEHNTEDHAVKQKLVMAILALVVFMGGMWLVVTAADTGNVVKPALRGWMMSWAPGLLDHPAVPRITRFGLGVVLVLWGAAVLLLTRWRQRYMRFRTEHGEVRVDLNALRRGVTEVARSLPEIRKATVILHPLKDGRSLEVTTRLWLRDTMGQGLKRTAEVVANCIEEAVRLTMGLGGQVRVNLEVEGIEVDAREITRRVQEQMEAETATAALPRPPLAAVMLDTREPSGALDEIASPERPASTVSTPRTSEPAAPEEPSGITRSPIVTPPPDDLSQEELARLAAIESEQADSSTSPDSDR
ncbi:MAG TPA: hypothetical protein PK349_13530 [Candidatus Hydrogenedentes bacterium]|nr:hypothetical protein [Candidatus Hydrogenedentota bacterium]